MKDYTDCDLWDVAIRCMNGVAINMVFFMKMYRLHLKKRNWLY